MTERHPPDALIVAHGQPSDPAPAEAALTCLARAVAAHLSGRHISSATLASPGALTAALAGASAPVIYPMFMADGWFVGRELPRRLEDAGAAEARILPPFGRDENVQALAGRLAAEAARARGWRVEDTVLILAAHGSGRSRRPAGAARETAARIAAGHPFREVRTGFVEQAPGIAEAARGAGERALCLPLFAAAGGHVGTDVPEALERAGFAGALLPPLGTTDQAPAAIACGLAAALAADAAIDRSQARAL